MHHLAIPLSLLGGLAIGYCLYLSTVSGYSILEAIATVIKQFGAGLLGGFVLRGLLVTLVKLEQVYSFRRHRRTSEETFREMITNHLALPEAEIGR